jgi:hypothetical protein
LGFRLGNYGDHKPKGLLYEAREKYSDLTGRLTGVESRHAKTTVAGNAVGYGWRVVSLERRRSRSLGEQDGSAKGAIHPVGMAPNGNYRFRWFRHVRRKGRAA